MPKYKNFPKGFQPIPTPEEEARDDVMERQNRGTSRILLAALIMFLTAIFHTEIAELADAVRRLFT